MNAVWTSRETTTHQDHVIAHVVGATVRGYFVFDEAVYLLLDIGFVWTIFLDGEMALVPHPVASSELEIDPQLKEQIKADIELLLSNNYADTENLGVMTRISEDNESPITEVEFLEQGDRRRLLVNCEAGSLVIETSLTTAEIQIYDHE